MSPTPYVDADAAMTATNIGLLANWPDLKAKLIEIYRDRIAKLPFVPATWEVAAIAHLNDGSNSVWVPTPIPSPRPGWLMDTAAAAAWMKAAKAVQAAIGMYAAGKAEEGRAELARLYMAAAFWNGLYVVAVEIRDAPATVLSAAGEVAGGIVDGAVSGIWSSTVGKVLLIGVPLLAIGAAWMLFPNLKKGAIAALKLPKA